MFDTERVMSEKKGVSIEQILDRARYGNPHRLPPEELDAWIAERKETTETVDEVERVLSEHDRDMERLGKEPVCRPDWPVAS